jgi:hypothetical protein
MMKKMILAAAAVLVLGACNDSVNGTLQVDHPFQVTNKDGDSLTLPAGVYNSTLKLKDSHTLDVIFKTNGQNQTVRIKLPKGQSLPTNGNGQFVIKGDDVGTGFDISGNLVTTVAKGPQQQGFASCYMQPLPPICYPGPNGQTYCQPQGPSQGIMTVIYHVETTTTNAVAEFSA